MKTLKITSTSAIQATRARMSQRPDKRVVVSLLRSLFIPILDDTLSKVIHQLLLKLMPNAKHAMRVPKPQLSCLLSYHTFVSKTLRKALRKGRSHGLER